MNEDAGHKHRTAAASARALPGSRFLEAVLLVDVEK